MGYRGDGQYQGQATPPQWQQGAPPRQDGRGGYPPQAWPQPQFQPGPQPPAYQPGYQQPQYPPQAPRKSRKGLVAGLGCGGLAVLVIVIAAVAASGAPSPSAPAASQAAPGTVTAPAAAAPASSRPAGTTSELEALTAAEGYLTDGQGFSRQGLIDQLDSSFGNSFSVADATWGVDHSGANWNDQAVDCAKGYMSDGQGFSRQGLIDQMTSSYGSKFTQAQATYAADAVGL